MDSAVFRPARPAAVDTACSGCTVREHCLPAGLSRPELDAVDKRLVSARRKVERGHVLYRASTRFDHLYAARTGFFKSSLTSGEGREQVTGFQMGGELLGLDGMAQGLHQLDVVALEDSQVCAIPIAELDTLARQVPSLLRQLHRHMGEEVMRTQGVMLLLGSMSAEERLASFLLNLALRMKQRGFSASSLVLRMTREEIGSYLGLTFETVSRTFSKLQADGLLFVRHRHIHLTDPVGLQRLVDEVPG
jgi:CRP/FNR family transcriptional regulator, anaerobic regulatory protein